MTQGYWELPSQTVITVRQLSGYYPAVMVSWEGLDDRMCKTQQLLEKGQDLLATSLPSFKTFLILLISDTLKHHSWFSAGKDFLRGH